MPILNAKLQAEKKDAEGKTTSLSPGGSLQQAGPLVQLTLTPLEEHAKAIAEKEGAMPEPVSGFALIDTGAVNTCVDQEAAKRAGLVIVDSGKMTSATHKAEVVPVYAGAFDFANFPINLVVQRAYGAHLAPQGLIALIGRDVLQRCLFIYNGPDGSFSLSL